MSAFVVIAKILLQELWTRGYDWDDVILDEIGDKILRWFQQLGSLASLRVPRCLRQSKKVLTKKIITFVDASTQAYGAVVYLLCEYEDQTTSMRKLQYKSIQNLQTLEGYIFYILQHFATKLCNFTNFSMPFREYTFLLR